MKEQKFPHNRKHSHRHICAELWNLRGQYNREEKRKKERNTEILHLAVTPSGKVAQTLQSASSEQELNREVPAACLGWGQCLNALRTIWGS